jgi:Fur family peroxide stress response transcriptional regulator
MSAARQAGVKLTHQRIEIFREVAASVEHPSAETVHQALSQRMPTLSHDTVYRTLWLLSELGLVTTLGPRRDSVRFDANPHPHHHYICVRCGMARDFESSTLSGLPLPESQSDFGSIKAMQVEVRGVCRRCLSEQEEKSKTNLA